MTRMTKQIHLALLSAALTASGCGQKAAPQPVAANVQPAEWGDNPPPPAEEDWGQDEESTRANHAARARHTTHLFLLGGAIHSIIPGPAPVRRTSTGVRPGMGTTILPGHTSGTSSGSKSGTSSVTRGGFGSTGGAISGSSGS